MSVVLSATTTKGMNRLPYKNILVIIMPQSLHLLLLENHPQLGKQQPEERLEPRDHALPNQELLEELLPEGLQPDGPHDLGQHAHPEQKNQNELLVKESGNECAGYVLTSSSYVV